MPAQGYAIPIRIGSTPPPGQPKSQRPLSALLRHLRESRCFCPAARCSSKCRQILGFRFADLWGVRSEPRGHGRHQGLLWLALSRQLSISLFARSDEFGAAVGLCEQVSVGTLPGRRPVLARAEHAGDSSPRRRAVREWLPRATCGRIVEEAQSERRAKKGSASRSPTPLCQKIGPVENFDISSIRRSGGLARQAVALLPKYRHARC